MSFSFDELEGIDVERCSSDVCPSCGAVLATGEQVTEGCNDPMGCGILLEHENFFDDEESELQELNFDE